jgi:hypothetical protein
VPDDDEIERLRLLWRDDGYLSDLAKREVNAEIEESLASTSRLLEMSKELREEREAKERTASKPDFPAIFKKNVSLAKQMPVRKLEDEWAAKEEAASQDAEQGFTTLGNAREDQFGGKKPVVYEGRIIEVVDPNHKEEQVKEVRKGTHSRHVHKPKTSRSGKLRSPAKPGRGGDKDSPEHNNQLDGERIIR